MENNQLSYNISGILGLWFVCVFLCMPVCVSVLFSLGTVDVCFKPQDPLQCFRFILLSLALLSLFNLFTSTLFFHSHLSAQPKTRLLSPVLHLLCFFYFLFDSFCPYTNTQLFLISKAQGWDLTKSTFMLFTPVQLLLTPTASRYISSIQSLQEFNRRASSHSWSCPFPHFLCCSSRVQAPELHLP